jgi:membrane protein
MPSGRSRASRKPSRGLRDLEREDFEKAAKASYARFGEVGLTDRAATLAYYGFLSLLPGLIVAVSMLALLGSYPETYESMIETLREAAPGTAVDALDGALEQVFRGGGAGSLLGFGLAFSLVTASGAVGAAIRALEAINGTRRSATFVRSNLTRVWLTLALMALFLIAFAALLIAGPLFGSISEAAGLGDTGRTAVRALRYPVGFAALLAALLLLYTQGPAGTRRRLVDHMPGAVLAGGLWVIASAAFSFYVSNFGSYNAAYGTLGAVIVLLIWIYVGAVAVLIGALANRELLRVRQTG